MHGELGLRLASLGAPRSMVRRGAMRREGLRKIVICLMLLPPDLQYHQVNTRVSKGKKGRKTPNVGFSWCRVSWERAGFWLKRGKHTGGVIPTRARLRRKEGTVDRCLGLPLSGYAFRYCLGSITCVQNATPSPHGCVPRLQSTAVKGVSL